jgi:hypothetical protein
MARHAVRSREHELAVSKPGSSRSRTEAARAGFPTRRARSRQANSKVNQQVPSPTSKWNRASNGRSKRRRSAEHVVVDMPSTPRQAFGW